MDIRRLKHVEDTCPLFLSGALPPYDATHWAAQAQMQADNVTYRENGYSSTVFNNRIITWHRSFSTDNNPVREPFVNATSRALINIDEWVPGFGNDISKHGYFAFGAPRRHGIAEIPPNGSVEQNWSTHAKRHLKTFRKQTDITVRLGTLNEIDRPYRQSSVPTFMRKCMWELAKKHIAEHPETVEVLIAESAANGVIAAFVSGTCHEASSSYYILGFYLPVARPSQAMTGLIHEWFERSRAKNLKLCNFGDMCGPNPLPLQSDRGYSIFKTHFGIRRVHYPGSHWKISFR